MLGVSERTARRYRDLGLPVVSPKGGNRRTRGGSGKVKAPVAAIMIWIYERMWGPMSGWTKEQKNRIMK